MGQKRLKTERTFSLFYFGTHGCQGAARNESSSFNGAEKGFDVVKMQREEIGRGRERANTSN